MGADRVAAPTATVTDTPADRTLARWFAPVLEHGGRWVAPNLDTRCAFLRVGELELPLTVNEAEWGNSWVCSPYTHYVSYATEEIRGATGRCVAAGASAPLAVLGAWFRHSGLNNVVMVNNWLMSTNPWPRWTGEGLVGAVDVLRGLWPRHTIVFRSLNEAEDLPLLVALERLGARVIPSRQVWLFEPKSEAVRRSTNLRHDRQLLHRDDLQIVPHEELTAGDFPRLTALYHQLYLEKHSRHNPAYTAEWLRHLWASRLLRFTALREPGVGLVGVEARGVLHGTMVSPVVGYDLSRPRALGLYRRLAAIPVLAARDADVPLNLSAGVGRFKATRGGRPVMEYLGVVDSHLPLGRRAPWSVVEGVSRHVLAPVVRRRGL